jgi:hypothetical protein
MIVWARQKLIAEKKLHNKTSRRVLCMDTPLLWWESDSRFGRNNPGMKRRNGIREPELLCLP